jgi:hypothetical protein
MHEEKFNYVLESSQSARWLLTEDKLADAMRLKERQYSSCVEKIKDYEKRMAIKRDSSHYVGFI